MLTLVHATRLPAPSNPGLGARHERLGDAPPADAAGRIRIWPLQGHATSLLQAARRIGSLHLQVGSTLCRMGAQLTADPGGAAAVRGVACAPAGLRFDPPACVGAQAFEVQRADGGLRHGLRFHDEFARLVARADFEPCCSPAQFEALVQHFGQDGMAAPGSVQPRRALADGAPPPLIPDGPWATSLALDELFDVLRHARSEGIELALTLERRGARLSWSGSLERLSLQRSGVTVAGPGMRLRWSDDPTLLQAHVLSEPRPDGLGQSLLLSSARDRTRLLVMPARSPRRDTGMRARAWRAALALGCGGHGGCAC